MRIKALILWLKYRMKKKTKQIDSGAELSHLIAEGLEERKGKDTIIMDLRKAGTSPADFFVICTGTSDTHVKALCDSVYDYVKQKIAEKPRGIEGMQTGEWVLMDYTNVIVHIFLKDRREFYSIEELWGDAEFEKIKNK